MAALLNDILNLQILENICAGKCVDVNINGIANALGRHRNTVKNQVKALFSNGIINRPIYPFIHMYEEYPLMVVARAQFPRNQEIDEWFKEDEHIFAAFHVRDEEFNTLLIEYHENIHTYGQWKKKLVAEEKIPPREIRHPAHVMMFSNRDMIKYEPHSPYKTLVMEFKNRKDMIINDMKMSELSMEILNLLVHGEGVRTNENKLAKALGVHRRTIERRISTLIEKKIVSKPLCRFPTFFVPPGQILVYYLVEIKKAKVRMVRAIRKDPHITLAIEAGVGRYNYLLFGVFPNVEEHFLWEERYDDIFKDNIGAMKKIYLSPKMAVPIDQQKVSLGIIKRRMELLTQV